MGINKARCERWRERDEETEGTQKKAEKDEENRRRDRVGFGENEFA